MGAFDITARTWGLAGLGAVAGLVLLVLRRRAVTRRAVVTHLYVYPVNMKSLCVQSRIATASLNLPNTLTDARIQGMHTFHGPQVVVALTQIKSCRGVGLREARVDAGGIQHDREWMVVRRLPEDESQGLYAASTKMVTIRDEHRIAVPSTCIYIVYV